MLNGNPVLKPFQYLLGMMLSISVSCLQAQQLPVSEGRVEIQIASSYVQESLLIMLDSQDITAFASATESGVNVTLPPLSASTQQTLVLSFTTLDGYDVTRRIELQAGQENYYNGSTGLGIIVRGKLHDRNDINKQDHEVDAHVDHQGRWGAGAWGGDVSADVWLFDRGTDITPLEDNHAEVINYYASASHYNERRNFLAEAGYIQLNESPNTLAQLARRGARASVHNDRMSLDIFSVNSQQHLGSKGGAGIGDGSEDTIAGFSAGWNPIVSNEQTVKLRAIYSKGAENGDSFGILNNNTSTSGDVAGLLLESRFANLGLNIEAEIDRSSFDADTSDAVEAIDDDAYALRLRGNAKGINYRAAFEHIGTNYAVVANPLLQNDREYLTLGADFDRGEHGFGLQTQVEHDNLDNETTRSQLNKTYVSADYRYRKGRSFSSLLSLQNNQIDSSKEPTITDIRDTTTNSLLAKLSFAGAKWNNQFSVLLSDLKDKTDANNDSQIVSFSYSPALNTLQFYFTPSFSFTETEFNNGQKTRQDVFSLYLQGKAFSQRLDYQLSASVSELTDDANNDEDTTTVLARSLWSLGKTRLLSASPQHSVGLELEYFDTDNTGSGSQKDSILWLIYSLDLGVRS